MSWLSTRTPSRSSASRDPTVRFPTPGYPSRNTTQVSNRSSTTSRYAGRGSSERAQTESASRPLPTRADRCPRTRGASNRTRCHQTPKFTDDPSGIPVSFRWGGAREVNRGRVGVSLAVGHGCEPRLRPERTSVSQCQSPGGNPGPPPPLRHRRRPAAIRSPHRSAPARQWYPLLPVANGGQQAQCCVKAHR